MYDLVLSHDHVERCLTHAEAGAYRQPPGKRADNQKCVTRTNRLSGRRRNLRIELIAANIGTIDTFSALALVTVYRITDKRDDVPASEVAATDCPRVFYGQKLPTTKRARKL